MAVGKTARLHLGDTAVPPQLLRDMAIGAPGLIADDARLRIGSHEGIAGRLHWCGFAVPAGLPDDMSVLIPGMILSVVPSRLMAGISLRVMR